MKPRDYSVSAYERAIRAAGGRSFSDEFVKFAAATAEWNSSDAFPDTTAYPDMKRKGRLKGVTRLKLDHTSYRLLDVDPSDAGELTLKAKIERRTQAGIALVGRTGPRVGGTVDVVSAYTGRGGKIRVELPRASSYDRLTAVAIDADGRLRNKGRRTHFVGDNRNFKLILKRG